MNNKNILKEAAFAICMASVFLLSGCGSENREESYLEKAREHIEAGNYQKAEVDIKNVLQINANNIEGRLLLVEVAENEKEWRTVFSTLLFIIEKEPNNYAANEKLAQIYLSMKNVEDAQLYVDKMILNDPDRAASYSSLGMIKMFEGDIDAAKALAEKALKRDPSDIFGVNIFVQYHKGDTEKGLAIVRQGLDASPDNQILYRLLIALHSEAGDVEGVRSGYSKLIALAPQNVSYYEQLFKTYLSVDDKDYQKVIEILDSGIAANPDNEKFKVWKTDAISISQGVEPAIQYLKELIAASPESFLYRGSLAKLYFGSDQYDLGMSSLNEAIDYNPVGASALSARVQIAGIYYGKGDIVSTDKYLDETLDIDPNHVDALYLRAKILVGKQDYDGAISALRILLNSKPDSVSALLLIGNIYEVRGDSLLSIDSFRKVLSLQPNNIDALNKLGVSLAASGEQELAEQQFKRALELQPGNVNTIRSLADIYSAQQRWDEAKELLEPLEGQEQLRAFTRYVKARILLRENKLAEAEPLLVDSITANPNIIEPLTTYVQLLVSQERSEDAKQFVMMFIKDNPTAFHGYESLGFVKQVQGDREGAIADYQKSIELNSVASSSYIKLAALYMSNKNYQQAEEIYRDVISETNEPEKGELALAELFRFQQRYDESRIMYKSLLQSAPNSAVAKNNYAVLLLDYFGADEDLREARELLVGFEDSNVPAFLDTFGWLQYRLGNYTQAVSFLKLAIKRGGEGAEFDYHLGMAYKASGMNEEAKQLLQSALAVEEQDFTGKQEAKQALADL
ncbi:Beta-barrel assembly-enhancing protease [Sinobacterium norvegicum]|uniref:Beta-barrel assembly-enhancing protease n=1 Tax=Sinobacterium norvegicum TaxID=1641715 RepID=A0ABN8EMI5_9GAMM|nr:tetratricopeptide repeat protein [Sinobacterium norvegicum]CAH0993319.1 Beta-barrel assembly-enhancing protease [Sinobacterium norvegicum]